MEYVIGGLMLALAVLVLVLAWMSVIMPEEDEDLGAWQDSDPRTVRGLDGQKYRRPR